MGCLRRPYEQLRRQVKGKGENEKHIHLKAELQRTARRDQITSLVINAKKQRKTTEWERLETSPRKWDTKGTFHAQMGTKKERNSMDLTEAESLEKRWQEYTELYKKGLHDVDNHDGVIIHLEPDILQCKIRGTSGSITMNKASGGDGIPAELFQILKGDAVKVPHSIFQQIRKTQQWPQN